MDIIALLRSIGIFRGISTRVSSLSLPPGVAKRLSFLSLNQAWRRRLFAVLLIVLSVGAALKGAEICRESALHDWERIRFPSEGAWVHALGSRGFRRLEDPRVLQKVSHQLPMSLDSNLSAWISPDSRWVAVFLKPDSALPEAIFCFQCGPPWPRNWDSMGNSWEGFDHTLERLDSTSSRRAGTPAVRRTHIRMDPREIHY